MLHASAVNHRVGKFHIFLQMLKGKKISISDDPSTTPAVGRALAITEKYQRLTPAGKEFLEAQARVTPHPNSVKKLQKEHLLQTIRELHTKNSKLSKRRNVQEKLLQQQLTELKKEREKKRRRLLRRRIRRVLEQQGEAIRRDAAELAGSSSPRAVKSIMLEMAAKRLAKRKPSAYNLFIKRLAREWRRKHPGRTLHGKTLVRKAAVLWQRKREKEKTRVLDRRVKQLMKTETVRQPDGKSYFEQRLIQETNHAVIKRKKRRSMTRDEAERKARFELSQRKKNEEDVVLPSVEVLSLLPIAKKFVDSREP